MKKRREWLYLSVIAVWVVLSLQVSARTDYLDVIALQDLYTALNIPPQLKGWKLGDGDPCEELWTGVLCSGSSVTQIKLVGLELGGTLGSQLSKLHSLKHLDVSVNNIRGEIPYSLPLNATNINLACNNFSANIPSSLTSIRNLRHLNLSHNSLSGPIGNVFDGLHNLMEMDLSYNNFSGDLPSSFGSLTNLNRLFLQNNQFTGSVILLASLPLSDLDIQDNHFSGLLPHQFQYIHNLWFDGNSLKPGENDPPWNFPFTNMPIATNISSPPTTESTALKQYPSDERGRHKKKRGGLGALSYIVGGGTLLVTCLALYTVILMHRSCAKRNLNEDICKYSTGGQESPQISSIGSPSIVISRHLPQTRARMREMPKRSFSKRLRIPINVKVYTIAELESATNGFSEGNLVGEGSLGSVYKAEFPDGQILAVKSINTVVLSLYEEEEFMDVVSNAACLRHPNVVTLVGYCIEHGQHLLVYEYVKYLTLDDALHNEAYMPPLSWALRLRIAHGVAQALNYLHSKCLPPVAHSNLKSANILLDKEFRPYVADCGLAVLRPLTSNNVKVKASEMAISDTGYVAPEQIHHGTDSVKGDVYAFGVLLLELLTGKRPFDSLRPREEQSLVKWASSRLHDNEALEMMVDPSIKRTLSTRAISRFADIVSLCVQPEKEFRPPMTDIEEALANLIHKVCTGKSYEADCREIDAFDRSFRSTHTRFFGSPAASYASNSSTYT
ncbi:Non-specific serine/threonine protein kinase [Bertholletia excelsa]